MGLPIPGWFDPTQTRDGDGMLADGLRPSEVVHQTIPDPAEQAPLVARSVTPPSPSGRGGTTLLRQRAPRSCTVFVMTPPNEHTSEGGRDDRRGPVPCGIDPIRCSSAQQQTLIITGERGTVALRHEARCTCQCCPGLLSARPIVAGASAAVACLTAATGRRLGASARLGVCLLYTSPSPRDIGPSRMPSSA